MSREAIRRFLDLLGHRDAGGVTEVCTFKRDKPELVGYFDNLDKAAQVIAAYNGTGNLFASLNPVSRALCGRAYNKLICVDKRTKDEEVLCFSWLFTDCDPIRPAGISSTQEELDAAIEAARAVRDWFLSIGVPQSSMMGALSGNGFYVLVRLPNYSNTSETSERIGAVVNYIADLFDTAVIKIDRKVVNAARLIGAVGAAKVKGDPDFKERPHRQSRVCKVGGEKFDPEKSQMVEPCDLLALVEPLLPRPEPKAQSKTHVNGHGGFDIRNFADRLTLRSEARGYSYYDCPACEGKGKLHVNQLTGAYGCWHRCTPEDIRASDAINVPKHASRQTKSNSSNSTSKESQSEADDSIKWLDADKVQETEIDWLCYPYIARGYLTGVVGEEGIGKSYITLSIAAETSAGGSFFNGETTGSGLVLLLAAEDSYESVTVPRLKRLGADLAKIKLLDQALTLDERGLLMLEADVIRFCPTLIILDPAFAYTRGDTNTSKDSRAVLDRLALIAKKHGCAILLVRHIGKAKGLGDPRAAGLGSIEWRTVVRSELLIGKDPEKPNKRSLTHTKSNLSPLGKSWGYEIKGAVDNYGQPIRGDIGQLHWTGESDLTAERILSSLEPEESRISVEEAEFFPKQELQDGERYSEEIYTAAGKQGIAPRTLKRAIAKMGIKPRKLGFGKDGCWTLRLTDAEATITECPKAKQKKSEKTADDQDQSASAQAPKSANLAPKSARQSTLGTLKATDDSKAFSDNISPKSAKLKVSGTLNGLAGTLNGVQRGAVETESGDYDPGSSPEENWAEPEDREETEV